MTSANEALDAVADGGSAPKVRSPRVLVIDADDLLFGLLQAWLNADGCVVFNERDSPVDGVDLVVVDVPFPRQVGVDWVGRIAQRHPMAPILALSSTFIPGIDLCGPVARALGVTCVLPNPVSRETLTRAVRRFLSSRDGASDG